MLVSRDPFAREELHKEPEHGTCQWCGGQNRYGKVWRFRIERDGISPAVRHVVDKHLFCCKSCRESYNA